MASQEKRETRGQTEPRERRGIRALCAPLREAQEWELKGNRVCQDQEEWMVKRVKRDQGDPAVRRERWASREIVEYLGYQRRERRVNHVVHAKLVCSWGPWRQAVDQPPSKCRRGPRVNRALQDQRDKTGKKANRVLQVLPVSRVKKDHRVIKETKDWTELLELPAYLESLDAMDQWD